MIFIFIYNHIIYITYYILFILHINYIIYITIVTASKKISQLKLYFSSYLINDCLT